MRDERNPKDFIGKSCRTEADENKMSATLFDGVVRDIREAPEYDPTTEDTEQNYDYEQVVDRIIGLAKSPVS